MQWTLGIHVPAQGGLIDITEYVPGALMMMLMTYTKGPPQPMYVTPVLKVAFTEAYKGVMYATIIDSPIPVSVVL